MPSSFQPDTVLPIHMAAGRGQAEMIALLADYGVNLLCVRTDTGATPLVT
jgi:hypothetical protein